MRARLGNNNLVTDREPPAMALIEDILAERSVVHAPAAKVRASLRVPS
jgi:hypothetical protein